MDYVHHIHHLPPICGQRPLKIKFSVFSLRFPLQLLSIIWSHSEIPANNYSSWSDAWSLIHLTGPSPFLLGVLCSRSSRILLSRSLCASLLPSTGWCRGEEAKDKGSSSISPLPFAELCSSSLCFSVSCPSSSSSSSSSSSASTSGSALLGFAGRRSGSPAATSASPSAPLCSSASGGNSSPRPQEEPSSSQPAAPLGRSLFQAERPPFLL